MEQLIIISLLFIIILLLLNKKFSSHQINITEKKLNLPSVMGEIKKVDRKPVPSDVDQGQNESMLPKANNFESETREEAFENIPTKKDLDDILAKDIDLEEEEDEWQYQNDPLVESGFATGVTFQELSTAGQLLQQDMLEPDLEQQAVTIIQKIQGTELFDLLEKSIDDASKRIAALLIQSNSNEDEEITLKGKDDAEGFDIGEFV